jgi:hypothetical protein
MLAKSIFNSANIQGPEKNVLTVLKAHLIILSAPKLPLGKIVKTPNGELSLIQMMGNQYGC